ncbi:NUDIX hydrolase [Komagataeibacter nataicola]|uniref:NUDIX hydrolase n=1 Tax=Komagataeibacter nataicola TaxID=265960 RepID=A0A9N7CUD6_9PROT|nr:NUDIX domain-containing protein [Komagataeibacter nataicola]AQU86905.1 NUDIX hydrolase [Komagataeibacter nataicola]PYD67922.1 NUDIX hydrolase [Komagataeibacter nataicola]WEQ56143.1 NUDIX domain-containing protein [Komagataeibacter nataicola]WNM07746.1 NUDIX domain-containing protein [Komagataeibacter nataicola]GBR23981.1 phosphohydrolase [Komagataeibacter nataicola NRIC 0616]
MTGIIRVVCAAVIEHERLLVVRKRGTTAFMLPGGKPEADESPEQALVREIDEELGCALTLGAELAGDFSAPAANEPGYAVQARIWTGRLEGKPAIAAEIAELRWITATDAAGLCLAPLLSGKTWTALARAGLMPQLAMA